MLELVSPEIRVDSLEGTRWRMKLLKTGFETRVSIPKNISLSLQRELEDDGPDNLTLIVELTFLRSNGWSIYSQKISEIEDFRKNTSSPSLSIERNWKYGHALESFYFPQDTMVVVCRMWKKHGGSNLDGGQCFARTRIVLEQFSFSGVTDKFSTLLPMWKRAIHLKSTSGKQKELIMFSHTTFKGNIVIEVSADFENMKLSICKILILDSFDNWEQFGIYEYWKKPGEVFRFELLVDHKNIDFWKEKYIPNGRLTLKYVISFTTKDEPDIFEAVEYGYGIPQKNIERPSTCIKKAQASSASEERKGLSRTFKDEMTSLYKEGILCDTHLRTEAESFPAHKAVLSASSRSYVPEVRGSIGCWPLTSV
ncbi:uncharacterized protein CDAR_395031 [Caerostris darwini]|uniref:BTB domain-containing protein n=1 Tax=Caerostris darwini TaxID=1538125 RepID=A0AAV4T8S1_9ARAC|nr:uncharacterized protein CDAR_395031 [Caerostris darwini]